MGSIQQYLQPLLDGAVPTLSRGGPVIALLLVLSLIALTIIIAKWLQFAWLGINRSGFIQHSLVHWRKGNYMPAMQMLGSHQKRPVAQVVETAMSGLMSKQPVDAVKAEVTRVAKSHIAQLRSWLKPLELIANISPLIGLLGTVLGMIEAFRQLEQAGNQVDPSILSGGIWQALLTTAVGLMVAIPALLAHQWLERRVERSAHLMEDSAAQVFTSLPTETADWRTE